MFCFTLLLTIIIINLLIYYIYSFVCKYIKNIYIIHKKKKKKKNRHSINLWWIYIMIELDNNNLDHAKSLFFQAIRECPWSKELYLIPYKLSETFLAHFTPEELEEIMNTMEEKELRIRNLKE